MHHVALTPMEEQIVQVLASLNLQLMPADGLFFNDDDIKYEGAQAISPNWGGSIRWTTQDEGYYPLINRFLGSLQTKGLVQRIPSFDSRSAYGLWRLSPQGRELAGLAPYPQG